MSESERRQKSFYSRAQHQLKQIQFSCREVISLSHHINSLATEINNSDVNARKIEFIKGEIKEKLKDFANNINQIYQILDRKVVILSNELQRELTCKYNKKACHSQQSGTTGNRSFHLEKDTQKTGQKSHQNSSFDPYDKIFSDTLNPRITQLEAKLAQHEHREKLANSKISQLKLKNERLLEEFNRLSTASNQKINQLSFQLQNRSFSQKDSFTSNEPKSRTLNNSPEKSSRPFLHFKTNKQGNTHSLQEDYQLAYKSKEIQTSSRMMSFGCMPSRPKGDGINERSRLKQDESCEKLDRQDRTRRFDLLLNKLKIGQQGAPQVQNKARKDSGQQVSVFSQDIIRRYQI